MATAVKNKDSTGENNEPFLKSYAQTEKLEFFWNLKSYRNEIKLEPVRIVEFASGTTV
jgi:hypothetical protein